MCVLSLCLHFEVNHLLCIQHTPDFLLMLLTTICLRFTFSSPPFLLFSTLSLLSFHSSHSSSFTSVSHLVYLVVVYLCRLISDPLNKSILSSDPEVTLILLPLFLLLLSLCLSLSGPEKGRCVASEYFTEPEIEITTENTANILSK